MSTINISISQKGLRKETVQKKVAEIIAQLAPKATFSVSVFTPPTSRSARFEDARAKVEEARNEFESLRDECQEWYDNLPEAFQSGDKGSQLEEAISNLEQAISSCEEVEGTDVEFPGMYS